MGSRSVICHLSDVTFPHLFHPIKASTWHSIQRPRRDARPSWPSWLVTYWLLPRGYVLRCIGTVS